MKYVVIDKPYEELYSNIIFECKRKMKRIYIRPTINNETIGAYSNYKNVHYDKVIEKDKTSY